MLAISFSPCLPRKMQSHGLGVRLQWAFTPVRRGRSRFMDLVCACDALSPLPVQEMAFSCTRRECSRWTSPLPVKEKAISWTWCALAGGFPKRPGTPPEVPGELPKPKHAIIVNNCTTKVMVFGTRSKLYISRCFCSWPREAPRKLQEASRLTFYPAFRRKVYCGIPWKCL